MHVLVMETLTLPEVTQDDLDRIAEAAGPDSRVTLVKRVKDALPIVEDVEAIIGVCPEWLFDAAPNLKWVHATASGVDMFMYDKFKSSAVILTGEKGLVGSHLADTGMGLLLGLTRRIAQAIRYGTEAWDHREEMRMEELELEGMTMGIVGFGGTGKALARRARGFDMRTIAVDMFPGEVTDGVEWVKGLDDLDELLAESDVVAIGAPLTAETDKLFDAGTFAKMKPGSIIMNVTRGEIVDGDALVEALRSGHLGGAALDVVPGEPLPADHPLHQIPTCVMTPHTAGASQLRAGRGLNRFITNLSKYRAGEPLDGLINKELGF